MLYNYTTPYNREDTVKTLLAHAAEGRRGMSSYWKRMRSYYDGTHSTAAYANAFGNDNGIDWQAAQSTDGYIHVESQIDASLPEFEFSPRGKDDGDKAKQREKIVRYICDRNDLEFKNSRNERRLGIYGSAVWKVCWDSSQREDGTVGEVVIDNPAPQQIFPDPAALRVDDCEYIGYVYPMHIAKAHRVFGCELSERGIDLDDIVSSTKNRLSDSADEDSVSENRLTDTVRITEWWFRQPCDGEATFTYYEDGKAFCETVKYRAGDIALSVLIGDYEVRYIPKYWLDTDCTMFPFVIYDRLPKEKTLWGRSELEAIIPFIDAADREIAYAQLNSAFSSNDVIVAEENAFADDSTLDNTPGAIWKLRPGMMGKVQRLGNAAYSESYLHANFDKWRSLMQETTGNFAITQGSEPDRVTTATGIALLNERARSRNNLKRIDKSAGFARLFELCDRTALEYYDDGRVILSGAADEEDTIYVASDFKRADGDRTYIPRVDIRIHIGDGLANSKAFTVSAVSSLISTPITAENYRIVKSYLELIDLPMRQEISDMLDERFEKDTADTTLTELLTDLARDSEIPAESEESANE